MTDTQVEVHAERDDSPRQGIAILGEADAPTLHDAGVMENHSSAIAAAKLCLAIHCVPTRRRMA
jgi:hypothetical protein